MTTCRHCGKAIVYEPEAGRYWYHTATQSVWCWPVPASPAERQMRATP